MPHNDIISDLADSFVEKRGIDHQGVTVEVENRFRSNLAPTSAEPSLLPPEASPAPVERPPTNQGGHGLAVLASGAAASNGQNDHKLLALIERIATDPGADVEKLERMMALYERLEANRARQAYNEAMNRAQAEIEPVARATENTITKSFYAKLEAVDAAIRLIYIRHGFSLSDDTVAPLSPGHIRIECRCSHVGGHTEIFHREAPADTMGPKGSPTKTVLHGIGSTETFLRRYLRCGIFNVVFKNLDDDGVGDSVITDDQVSEILDKIKLANVGPRFLQYVKAQSVEEAGSLEAAVGTIPARNYRRAVSALDERIAQRGS